MKRQTFIVKLLVLAIAGLFPLVSQAAIPAVYTNANLATSEQDKPVSLYRDSTGGFYGYTATGKRYQQVLVANDLGVRLMRFSIDQAFFYVSDRGVIYAPDNLTALSIYFARA